MKIPFQDLKLSGDADKKAVLVSAVNNKIGSSNRYPGIDFTKSILVAERG